MNSDNESKLKIRIPSLSLTRLEIIDQQLKYYKQRLMLYETKEYRESFPKEKIIEDIHDATTKFRFFIVQKEIELEKNL